MAHTEIYRLRRTGHGSRIDNRQTGCLVVLGKNVKEQGRGQSTVRNPDALDGEEIELAVGVAEILHPNPEFIHQGQVEIRHGRVLLFRIHHVAAAWYLARFSCDKDGGQIAMQMEVAVA